MSTSQSLTQQVTDEVTARILLARVSEPGDCDLVDRVRSLGAQRVADEVLTGHSPLPRSAGYATRLADPRTSVTRDVEQLQQILARVVVPGTPCWPTQLDDLGSRAPLLLFVRGPLDLRVAALRSVSLVGARASTPYGDHVAGELSSGLSQRGWAVVSGGAFGIDAAAHRGALAASGSTMAVLACGIDVAYPPSHSGLFARIAADGLLLSEVPPGAAPHRGRFLVRNRVIAALTRGTVVVEAALRSGALSTAREARDLGRVVLGVPGPVTSAMSGGVHRLIRDGALLVGSIEEVVEAVGELGSDLAPHASGPARARDGLDPELSRVLDAVPSRRGLSVESISRSAGVEVGEVLSALALLELSGFVERRPGGWVLGAAGRMDGAASGASG